MNPFAILLILFIGVPLAEIYLLITVGGWIGAGWTVFLVLLTAVIGTFLLRQQGLSTLFRARQTMDSGGVPALELLEGLVLAVGGALLLTPGFITDAVGFACLLPLTRQLMVRIALARMHPQTSHPRTLEGDFRRDD
ncbi:MAG: FxsA family protein [Gammaproteobacteria bacterium]|nr:FxsA family protein [Gammaproteobacteria bacterium]